MMDHIDCQWCKIDSEEMCDECVNRMHITNAHSPTQSYMIGTICYHREVDGLFFGDQGTQMNERIFILNDDWIKNLKG